MKKGGQTNEVVNVKGEQTNEGKKDGKGAERRISDNFHSMGSLLPARSNPTKTITVGSLEPHRHPVPIIPRLCGLAFRYKPRVCALLSGASRI